MNEQKPSRERLTDEELELQLQEAGPRLEVPAEHLADIDEAVRAQWRASLAGTREPEDAAGAAKHSRAFAVWLAAAAVLLVTAGVVWMWPGGPELGAELAVVELARAAAGVDASAGAFEVQVGGVLRHGDQLSTAPQGVAALRLASGHSVRLAPNSTVRVIEGHVIELLDGAAYIDSGHSGATEQPGIAVQTVHGVVREIGTQFEVRLSDIAVPQETLRVRVREGLVVLTPGGAGGATHEASAGHQIVLAADGAATVRPLDEDTQDWRWVIEAAPPLELEGKSVDEVLRAAARELGFSVEYASEAARERAHNDELSSPPLPPRSALAAALQAAMLDGAQEEARLVVAVR